VPKSGEGTARTHHAASVHEDGSSPGSAWDLTVGAWQAAEVENRLNELMRTLLGTQQRHWWAAVARAAVDVVSDADLALVVAVEGPLGPRVVAAAGDGTETWPGSELALSAAVIEPVVQAGMNLVVPGVRLSAAGTSAVVSTLAAPLPIGEERRGALLVGRRRDRRGFTSLEMAPLGQLVRRVQLSLQLNEDWERRCQHRLKAERVRISTQAHEHIIAPLFAASMDMANLAGAADPVLRERLVEAVTAVDEVVGWLRGRLHPFSDG
jgi:hypothetical protein